MRPFSNVSTRTKLLSDYISSLRQIVCGLIHAKTASGVCNDYNLSEDEKADSTMTSHVPNSNISSIDTAD